MSLPSEARPCTYGMPLICYEGCRLEQVVKLSRGRPLLHGAGLVFVGGFEVLQNGSPFGWLAVLGDLGGWLVLAFPCRITRAKRRRTWIARQPYPHFADQGLKRGGFWRGSPLAMGRRHCGPRAGVPGQSLPRCSPTCSDAWADGAHLIGLSAGPRRAACTGRYLLQPHPLYLDPLSPCPFQSRETVRVAEDGNGGMGVSVYETNMVKIRQRPSLSVVDKLGRCTDERP